MNDNNSIKLMIYASLFTTLIIIGSYIAIPTGIVPIVIANMFIFIVALSLPMKWSLYSVTIYLLLGAIGLPVFSGGNGGFHNFYGPTGGYLIGYLVASFFISLISTGKPNLVKDIIALLVGLGVIHLLGILWLMYKFPQGWQNSLSIYWIFIIGDMIKLGIALVITQRIRHHLSWQIL